MVYSEDERKERKRIAQKKYYKANKKKVAEKNKKWMEVNGEYHKKYKKENPKTNRISNWKQNGIIDDDYDLLYDVFIKETNCWICGKDFNKDIVMDRRCLDHDHDITDDGNVRYILCHYCNLNVVVR